MRSTAASARRGALSLSSRLVMRPFSAGSNRPGAQPAPDGGGAGDTVAIGQRPGQVVHVAPGARQPVPGDHHGGIGCAPFGVMDFIAGASGVTGRAKHGGWPGEAKGRCGTARRPRLPDGCPQSGMAMAPAVMAMALPVTGVAASGGTLAAVMAGAAPGVPPRGTVRTTWLAGSALPVVRCSYTASSAWFRYTCSGT